MKNVLCRGGLSVLVMLPGLAAAAQAGDHLGGDGASYLEKGDYDGAIRAFTKAIQHAPADAEAYRRRALRTSAARKRAIAAMKKRIRSKGPPTMTRPLPT